MNTARCKRIFWYTVLFCEFFLFPFKMGVWAETSLAPPNSIRHSVCVGTVQQIIIGSLCLSVSFNRAKPLVLVVNFYCAFTAMPDFLPHYAITGIHCSRHCSAYNLGIILYTHSVSAVFRTTCLRRLVRNVNIWVWHSWSSSIYSHLLLHRVFEITRETGIWRRQIDKRLAIII